VALEQITIPSRPNFERIHVRFAPIAAGIAHERLGLPTSGAFPSRALVTVPGQFSVAGSRLQDRILQHQIGFNDG